MQGLDPETGKPIRITAEGGLIAEIRPGDDMQGDYLAPGLVDLQVNGYRGLDLNSGALGADEVIELCTHLARGGVTSFLPTLITASEASLIQALRAIRAARDQSAQAAHMIAGVHVEGPSISPEDGPRGAHPRADVRPPDPDEFRRWQEASGGLVRLVTLCPHHAGAEPYIRALASKGVLVSIGHTEADPDEIRAAAAAGATLSTHLGNGAAAQLPRHPNMIWTQLDLPSHTAMFIADGHHLPADVLRVMLRARGLENSILVSDAVALGGIPPGVYRTTVGYEAEVSDTGRISMAGTGYLAGAGMLLHENVAIAANLTDLGLDAILPLATRRPGDLLGGRGWMEVGQPADLMRFRWQRGARALDIREVWIAGRRVAP